MLERSHYDLCARMVAIQRVPRGDIVVIAITDGTLRRLAAGAGAFPWPASVYAPVLDLCREARVVGMDVQLAPGGLREDSSAPAFRSAMPEGGRMVVACERGVVSVLPPAEVVREIAVAHGRDEMAGSVCAGRTPPLQDPDEILRRYPAVVSSGTRMLPSLATAMWAGATGLRPVLSPGGVLEGGDVRWQLDREGAFALVPADRLPEVLDFADLLELARKAGSAEALDKLRKRFTGRHVLIGCLVDALPPGRVSTAWASDFPGVLVHATALQGLLENRRFVHSPSGLAVLLAVLFILPLTLPKVLSPAWIATFSCLLALATIVFALLIAAVWLVVVPVTVPLASLLATALLAVAHHGRAERLRRAELENLERSKQQFTDMLAHDLKGRMGTMMASLGALEENMDAASAPVRRSFAGLRAGGARMLTQINALLDIRKMEEGALRIRPEAVSLNAEIEQAAFEHQGAASLSGMRVEALPCAGLVTPLQLDPDLLQRVLANLLWNAILYGARDGVITLRVRRDAAGIEVSVANAGRIIPAESRSALFKPFSRIAEGNNPAAVSTGLGLAFCRLATEALGGSIALHSPARGASDGVEVVLHFPSPDGS